MLDYEDMDPEIKEELARLQSENEATTQKMQEVEQGLQRILSNPKATDLLRNAVKEAGVEGIDIPENQIASQLKPMQAQLNNIQAQQEQKRLWSVLKEKGLTDDLDKIKKFQQENGITNDDSAIKLYQDTLPAPEVNRSVSYGSPFKKEGVEMDDEKIMSNILAGIPNL